jgi:hypothetical protein
MNLNNICKILLNCMIVTYCDILGTWISSVTLLLAHFSVAQGKHFTATWAMPPTLRNALLEVSIKQHVPILPTNVMYAQLCYCYKIRATVHFHPQNFLHASSQEFDPCTVVWTCPVSPTVLHKLSPNKLLALIVLQTRLKAHKLLFWQLPMLPSLRD